MKRLAQFACLLMIFGIVAVAAHADSTTGTVAPPDPKVILNDPACPEGAYCVDLTFIGTDSPESGSSETFGPDNPLEFTTPSPFPNGLSYTCGSDTFANCNTIVTQTPPIDFNGVYFWNGTLTVGSTYTIGSQGGPLLLNLPSDFSCSQGCSNGIIELTPEPSTAILYFLGFGLLFACTKRRFGFSSQA